MPERGVRVPVHVPDQTLQPLRRQFSRGRAGECEVGVRNRLGDAGYGSVRTGLNPLLEVAAAGLVAPGFERRGFVTRARVYVA
ncbi:hypothetical protein ADK76_27110 [Streptomyces griseoflavus]|nr:hypothetical protein ADK76_27110 [Streptomyces griseoflavus]